MSNRAPRSPVTHPVGLKDIHAARDRLTAHLRITPVLTSSWLNDHVGASVFFKCENFQKTGSFKIRGALNALHLLSDDERTRGVLTASSGNHGQALAYAAAQFGIDAHVVMPRNAPAIKVAAVRGYGARVVFSEDAPDARMALAASIQEETGAVFIPPFNDPRIIAGQGTATLELLDQAEGLDTLVVPVGGGGLASGTVAVAVAQEPPLAVIGVEPAGADDALRSIRAGHIIPQTDPHTIADGLRSSLGDLTFSILRNGLSDLVTVTDDSIIHAMRTVWERLKIVIEPSAAVPVAALLGGNLDVAGKQVGVLLSGGNADLDRLPWMKGATP